MKLSGKVVLITGGSQGLGSSIATSFSKAGAKVIVTYNKHKSEALKLITQLKQTETYHLDLSQKDMIDGLVEKICNKHKGIDVLINNAAIVADCPALVMTNEEWDKVLEVNLSGVFRICRAVGKYMSLQKSGRIINISSVVAASGGRGQVNYLASKGGLESITRGLAIEMAHNNILVNAVAPGILETSMSKKVLEKHHEKALSKVLLGRPARLEEIASLVLFLASDKASYITGQVIRVDGGFGLNF
jgi:3-oxoacyl-[acyl-carrier protein] reductase